MRCKGVEGEEGYLWLLSAHARLRQVSDRKTTITKDPTEPIDPLPVIQLPPTPLTLSSMIEPADPLPKAPLPSPPLAPPLLPEPAEPVAFPSDPWLWHDNPGRKWRTNHAYELRKIKITKDQREQVNKSMWRQL